MPPPAPTPTPPPTPDYANALAAGVRAGPTISISPTEAVRAYRAFQLSCPVLLRRADASGLTRPEDWRDACAGEVLTDPTAIVRFFERRFEPVVVGDGAAFATGYYEPEIRGCRTRRPGCETPVYSRPPDLLERNPRTGAAARGRLDSNGDFVPYYNRTEIEQGALSGRGLEIAYAADPVDLFFLQIQGSGRLRLPDGQVMRIGYAQQNGRGYVPIGRLLRERGLVVPPVTMQKIVTWLNEDPVRGAALMRENPSYVFFRELTGPGPLGSIGVAVAPLASVAVDPKFIPYGAPVLLSNMDNARADGLWIAQDTGGAIRGPNRVDTFWGAGEEAAIVAGAMASRGQAVLLLPRGALTRIRSRGQSLDTPPQR